MLSYKRLPNYNSFGDVSIWEDKITYYLNKYPQGSNGWKLNRLYKLNGSNIVKAIGLDPKYSPEKLLTEMIYNHKISVGMEIGESRGVLQEPIARKKYEEKFNVKIIEVGSASLKNEPRYSSSTDGIIYEFINGEWIESDTIIEIKCPKKQIYSIETHLKRIKNGYIQKKWHHNHIPIQHYVQMQMQMHILNKKNCIFYVDPLEGKEYIEKIPYNKLFVDSKIMPKLNEFLTMMDQRIDEMVIEYEKNIMNYLDKATF